MTSSILSQPKLRPEGGNPRFIRLALRLRVPLAWAMVCFAMLGLLAGFMGIDVLLRPLQGGAATHPATALCMMGLAVSIALTPRYGPTSMTRMVLVGGVLVICAARLMDAGLSGVTGTQLGRLFGPVGGFEGTFSVESAVTLGAFATAALMRKGSGRWGSLFLIAGLVMVFSTGVGSAFSVLFFQGNVSSFTMLGMVCASGAMVSVYVNRPIVRAAFLIGDVGSQTRVMGAAVLIVPMAAAVALHWAGSGLSVVEAGMVTAVTWSMLVILLSTSARHEGSVAARRRAERDIAMQSRIDGLTGALNRFGMTEVVEGAWLEFKSTGAQFGMILVDLNYFRDLDATFGNDDGEAVLTRVADTVQEQLRANDALGRWGADEFLVLLKIKNHANIAVVADRLRSALANPSQPFCAGLTMEPASIDAPFGVSALLDGDDAPTDAITRADVDLHAAKTAETQFVADLADDVPFQLEPRDGEIDEEATDSVTKAQAAA